MDREQIRDALQEQGFYTSGLPTAKEESGDVVNTNGRAVPRRAVESFPSDTGGIGVDGLYLTRGGSDLPTPAGTRAWA